MNMLMRVDDAEAAMLGGLLVHHEDTATWWRELEAEGLTPGDFFVPKLAEVAASISSLVSRGESPSPAAILDTMTPSGREMIGGLPGLGLLDGVTTRRHTRSLAQMVMRASSRRRVHRWHLEQAEAIAEHAELAEPDEWQSHLERTKGELANFAALGQASAPTVSSGEVLTELHRDLSNAAAGLRKGVDTGWDLLDLNYRPRPGHLVVEVGRPKMGKTSWQLSMTRQALFRRDSPEHAWQGRKDAIPVLWACDEMRNAELMSRLMADIADVNGSALANPPGREWLTTNMQAINRASKLLHAAPLEFIREADCGRLERIFAAARTWRAKQPVDPRTGKRGPAWLCLDYLQRLRMLGLSKTASREERVSEMCIAAKGIARELDITVFLLAQLNRDCEKRPNKRPVASDIRDSGSVEQEADCILAVYRHSVYDEQAETMKARAEHLRAMARGSGLPMIERQELGTIEARLSDAEIIICANRHGGQRTVPVDFEGSRFRFSPRAPRGES